jgi:hypothetical protein
MESIVGIVDVEVADKLASALIAQLPGARPHVATACAVGRPDRHCTCTPR